MVGKFSVGVTVVVMGVLVALAVTRWLDPEPAVYEVVLRKMDTSSIAVASAPGTCRSSAEHFEGLSQVLASAFRDANGPDAGFADVARLRNLAAVANSRQLAEYEANGMTAWTAGDPPLPVLRLSRVGFTPDGSEALLCVRGKFGASLFHLRRTGGEWVVVREEPVYTT